MIEVATKNKVSVNFATRLTGVRFARYRESMVQFRGWLSALYVLVFAITAYGQNPGIYVSNGFE